MLKTEKRRWIKLGLQKRGGRWGHDMGGGGYMFDDERGLFCSVPCVDVIACQKLLKTDIYQTILFACMVLGFLE